MLRMLLLKDDDVEYETTGRNNSAEEVHIVYVIYIGRMGVSVGYAYELRCNSYGYIGCDDTSMTYNFDMKLSYKYFHILSEALDD